MCVFLQQKEELEDFFYGENEDDIVGYEE